MSNVICSGDRFMLRKPIGRLTEVGQIYETGNITERSIIVRDIKSKVALLSIGADSFFEYFSKVEEKNEWTDWLCVSAFEIKGFYKTNGKKVMVKIDNFKAIATCHKTDDFNLATGVNLAYARCLKKKLTKQNEEIKEMLNALEERIKILENK